MKALVLGKGDFDLSKGDEPLHIAEIPVREPQGDEVLIKITCCGICHTEIDEIEGRATPAFFPIIPGHQVIGNIEKIGKDVKELKIGDRVGVAWVFSSCGKCEFCLNGKENLCADFKGTGKDANGGYAEFITIGESFAYPIPEIFSDAEAAPLLCAGAIGYRSLQLANLADGQVLGLSGFGASGHLVLKMAKFLYPNSPVLVFARSKEEQSFARSLSATWAGNFGDSSPQKLHAIIDTTPVWNTVISCMHQLLPGGRLVINAIRKESNDLNSLLQLDYQKHLWMEKEIKSVANITRKDVKDFLEIAAGIPLKPEIQIYPFEKANQALIDMKQKHAQGAKVLMMS